MDFRKKMLAMLVVGAIASAAIVLASTDLTDVWEAIFGVQEDVDSLSDEVAILDMKVDLLNEIADLKERIAVLEECGECPGQAWGPPDYDSEWVETVVGQNEITHNLGTTDLFVYMIGKRVTGIPGLVSQWYFGGNSYWNPSPETYVQTGACWYTLDPDTITAHVLGEPDYQLVRILLWKLPTPPA